MDAKTIMKELIQLRNQYDEGSMMFLAMNRVIVDVWRLDREIRRTNRRLEIAEKNYCSSNARIWIYDREFKKMHLIGEDNHDSLWVDEAGTVHYQNLQNGDGCGGRSVYSIETGYEFVPYNDFGIDQEWAKKHNIKPEDYQT